MLEKSKRLTKKQSKERDMKVVEFIKMIPCYSNTITKIFYTSTRMANKHLEQLYDYGYINRYRKFAHENYFYYTGKLKTHRKHYDIIARVYHWLEQNNYEILNCKVQVQEQGIRPDLILEIKQNNKVGILTVEIERSYGNLKHTIKKYGETDFNSLLLVSHMPTDKVEGYEEYIQKVNNINFKELE